MTPVVCHDCGNDEGPYGGLCLDCLTAREARGTGTLLTHDEIRLLLARASSQADCRRRRVGAVLVGTCGSVHGIGWNGLPSGSCLAGECPRGLLSYDEVPASSDYRGNCEAVHAEVAAIRAAKEHALCGTMFITDEPCPGCREAMARESIHWVVVGVQSKTRTPELTH